MYVLRHKRFRDQGLLEGNFLAQGTYFLKSTVAHHAFRRVLRSIHQTVRLDDPFVREYNGRSHDHPSVDLLDIHHRIDGRDRQSGNDVYFCLVLRVHELLGAVCRLLAGLHIHATFR